MSLYMLFPVSLLFTQTPREVYQNASILTTIWQHDRRVSLWQPYIRERSKYRCLEHARRGFTEHQCAVLILSHLAVILSSSHVSPAEGTLHLIFSSPYQPSVSKELVVLPNDVAHKQHLSYSEDRTHFSSQTSILHPLEGETVTC